MRRYLLLFAILAIAFAGCAPGFEQVDEADQYYSGGGQ